MQSVRTLIIDDEKLSSDALIWEIEGLKYPIDIVGTANLPQKGLEMIKELKPDLVFLDIEMPRMNGFDLLRSLDRIEFSVIFTTAYDQYALNAFEVDAFDYLLKPVSRESLDKAISKFIAEKQDDQWMNKLESLHEILTKNSPAFNKIAWPTNEGMEFVKADEIIRCESDSNYTHIKLTSGRSLLVSKTLSVVEEMIGSNTFLRVHKSHLINLNLIQKFVKADGGYIVMEDGSEVPVSRRKRENLASIFK